MDIQDQWPGGPGQADFAHLAIYWNGCVDGFLLLALCMMGVKRSVGHTDKEGALQNGPAFRAGAGVFCINEKTNIGYTDMKRLTSVFP